MKNDQKKEEKNIQMNKKNKKKDKLEQEGNQSTSGDSNFLTHCRSFSY